MRRTGGLAALTASGGRPDRRERRTTEAAALETTTPAAAPGGRPEDAGSGGDAPPGDDVVVVVSAPSPAYALRPEGATTASPPAASGSDEPAPGAPPPGPPPLAAANRAPAAMRRAAAWVRRLFGRRWMPLALLVCICTLSVGARLYELDVPREESVGSGFIFDEKYYVNASRVIAGVAIADGDTYATMNGSNGQVQSPAGSDQNGEHPQLGKVIIAAGIRLFGDNPRGWRLSAVLFGTLTLLLLYWLVRTAGGGSWLALGAVALAAGENLFLISSRIAVLDIYALPFMLAGAVFYLRRQPVVAGLVLGVGCTVKEFCIYALFALLLLEAARLLRWWAERRRAASTAPASPLGRRAVVLRLALPVVVTALTAVTYLSVLSALDRAVPPYHDGHRVDDGQASICSILGPLSGGCNHFAFMNHYAGSLTGIQGISSYPWQFWFDVEPINYYTVTNTIKVGNQVTAVDTVIAFQGLINPVLLAVALPAFLLNLWWAVRRRDDLSILVCVWYVATWLPAEVFNLFYARTTYLYYMVMTLPMICVAVARLAGARWMPRVLLGMWIGLFLAAFAILYPFRVAINPFSWVFDQL